MAQSPFKKLKFVLVVSTGVWIWAELHVIILTWFGFPFRLAILDSIVSNVLLVSAFLVVNNIFRYYLPQRQRYSYIFTLCAVLSLIWLLLSRAILTNIAPSVSDYEKFFSQSVPVRFAIAFLIIGCMALLCVLYYTLKDQQENEKRKADTERLAKEAELYKLRQQLQPHFLFNSLNSINALIKLQPDQARKMIQQLSDFLRGTLKKEEQTWVSLEEELQHLQLYLDIEKVRFGHRLSTDIIQEESSSNMQLPAMLLQPIVENAIKFGLYDTTDDIHIGIEAKAYQNDLIITVQNPFDPTTSLPKKGTGFGLNSVQRRLYLLFARQDLLTTEAIDHTFITIVKIPQQYDQSINYR